MHQLFDPSSYGQSPFAVPLAAVALLSYGVGIWVAVAERARQISLSFLASTLALATYLLGFAFMVGARDADVALWWGRFAYLGVPFIVPSVYHFSVHLLGIQRERRRLVRMAWLVGVAYMVLAVHTEFLVRGVWRTTWGWLTDLTSWNLPILAWSGVLLAFVVRDFARAHSRSTPLQRARIRWFAIPVVIACFGFVDYGASLGLPIGPWGFLFYPVYLLSAAWAVLRYHLPDLTPAYAAEQILATVADPLLVCDAEGRIVIANAAACRLLDFERAWLVGRPLATVFGRASMDLLLIDPVQERELSMWGNDGCPIDVAVTTGRLPGPDGRPVGTVVVARDIRERKRAAEALVRREQHYRALIENALDTIVVLGAEGRMRYLSPSIAQLLGWRIRAEIGTDAFRHVHEEDRVRVMEMFRQIVGSPGASEETTARIRHADGSHRWFELRARNLLDNPAVNGVVVNGRDISEARQLEAQLQQAQKLEAIGRLAGGVAHDFNNILTAIQGNVALVQEAIGRRSPLHAELEEVRRGAERAAGLTDQLLAFSRRQVVRPRLVDLSAMVLDIRPMLERLAGEDIRLVIELPPRLPPVRADRGHLEQVLLNLVANASDAMEGGGTIRIAARELRLDDAAAARLDYPVGPGHYLLFTVADDGVGMDAATRSRLFEPFFTTKGPGRGTGLGLSTVYGTIRQCGGYIGVQSEPGRGSTFLIYLPAAQEPPAAATGPDGVAPAAAADPPPPAAPAAPAAPAEGATVLVVEDEAPVRMLVRKILDRRGYRVLTAEDGEAALRIAAEHEGRIHLLIADLVMPGMSGREVAERLTALRGVLPTIFVSGYTADEVVRRGIVAGEHLFLPKPFTPQVLVERVREVLEGAPA